jgi:hypothetical protein
MRHPILLVVGVLLVCSTAMPAAGQDEGTPVLRVRALKAERLAALPQAAAAAKGPKTVVVDCTKKNSSISDALAKNTGPLVIEIHGICKENVLVERNDLTLRGVDPASDGIQGVIADPQPAALVIAYANRILLENMFVADSPGTGVTARYSIVDMRNCRIANNGGNGLQISASSGLTGTELVVSNNAGIGINSQRGGYVTCLGCRLEGNRTAASVRLGGFMTLLDTVVSGGTDGTVYAGITATDGGSYIDLDCVNGDSTTYPFCSVNVTGSAAYAYGGGQAHLIGVGPFTGRLWARDGGWVGVYGGQQTLPGTSINRIGESSRLTTGGTPAANGNPGLTKLGTTQLEIFSRASLYDATELLTTLTCTSGSDAWSDIPYLAAQVIGCTNVPKKP